MHEIMHKQVIEFRWLKTKRGGFDFISKLKHIGDTVLEGKKVTCMKPMHKQVIEFRWLKMKRGGFDFISKLKHIGDTVLEGKKVTCMK